MKLRILYHGNCFDGVSSAAIFTKFYKAKFHPEALVAYTPTMHRAGNALTGTSLTAMRMRSWISNIARMSD